MQLHEKSKSWYQYPLVWMMVFIPFSAIIMGVIMIWLAIDTNDGLVVDDYYKQGLEINRVIERDKKAAELGLSAVVELDNSARVIKMLFDKGRLESYPTSMPLQLQHATRENSDITVVLEHGIGDRYIGHLTQPVSEGVWYFSLAGNDSTSNVDTSIEATSNNVNWKISARSHVGKINTIYLKTDY